MSYIESSTSEPCVTKDQLLDRISELEEQISNLRRLESTLERNNALFHALLAASHEGIALTRTDATVIRLLRPILGFQNNDVCGLSLLDLVHPDDRRTMQVAHDDLVKRRVGQLEIEVRILRPDGSIAYVQDTIRDMLDNAAVQAIVHNYRDVTPGKKDEMAASELAAVVAHAPFAVFSKDLQGIVTTWNTGAEAMFGYKTEEIVGEHIWKLVPVENRFREDEARQAAIKGARATTPLRTRRICKDGKLLTIDLVLPPLVRGSQVRGIVHLSHPVAE